MSPGARMAAVTSGSSGSGCASMRQKTATAGTVQTIRAAANSKGMAGSSVRSRSSPATVCETAMPR
jgi:hypothetical protein